MTPSQELKVLTRICIMTYLEVVHLKKLLLTKGLITESDEYDFANSIKDYISELNVKTSELIKDFPGFGDQE